MGAKLAIYPGSFDPVTNGHLDIIKRSAKLFDKVIVLVAINNTKKYTFSVEDRVDFIKRIVKDFPNVEVDSYNGLVVSYAKVVSADVIIRGLRNESDYQNEINLYQYNFKEEPNVETVVLFPSGNNLFISSSGVKELAVFGANIDEYIPEEIKEDVVRKTLNR